MFKKDNKLNQWLWKWHFIAGLVSLPFIIVLAITGGIYLFKDQYEAPKQEHVKVVKAEGKPISFQEQWDIVKAQAKVPPHTMVISAKPNQATEFITGKFGTLSSTFVNPYNSKITGTINAKDSDMFKLRKLHGELLLGAYGTKIVELMACWLVVLIITGIYVFWPPKKDGIKGFFKVRVKNGKRILFRDLHTVLGFWISILLLMTLAGGLPWTDVFGDYFKWIQKVTNTGYPTTWEANGLQSVQDGKTISLDAMVALAKTMNLKGDLNIGLPKDEKGVYSIFNTTFDLDAQKRFHYDQYSGKLLVQHNWDDVGVLMRGRMWFMAFHQGQFGNWNLILMLVISILLTFLAVVALISYLKRKPNGKWGTPKVPVNFKVEYGVATVIFLLCLALPLFAFSVIIIMLIEFLRKRKNNNVAIQ